MTLNDWTGKPTLIEKAAELQQTPIYKEMIQVMREEMPLSKIPLPLGSNGTDFAYAHGMQKGFEYALKTLEALGQTAPELPQEPEATFSVNNKL